MAREVWAWVEDHPTAAVLACAGVMFLVPVWRIGLHVDRVGQTARQNTATLSRVQGPLCQAVRYAVFILRFEHAAKLQQSISPGYNVHKAFPTFSKHKLKALIAQQIALERRIVGGLTSVDTKLGKIKHCTVTVPAALGK